MTETVLRAIEDCDDFLEGATWMGAGGGGSSQSGIAILEKALNEGGSLA